MCFFLKFSFALIGVGMDAIFIVGTYMNIFIVSAVQGINLAKV